MKGRRVIFKLREIFLTNEEDALLDLEDVLPHKHQQYLFHEVFHETCLELCHVGVPVFLCHEGIVSQPAADVELDDAETLRL